MSFSFWNLIPFVLAIIFNSVMDRVDDENFFQSIFKNLKQSFWYNRESWKTSKMIFGYRLDAWHIAKTLMLASFAAFGVITFYKSPLIVIPGRDFLTFDLNLIAYCFIWSLGFNLFYGKLFYRK
jgi:hypothetical protein